MNVDPRPATSQKLGKPWPVFVYGIDHCRGFTAITSESFSNDDGPPGRHAKLPEPAIKIAEVPIQNRGWPSRVLCARRPGVLGIGGVVHGFRHSLQDICRTSVSGRLQKFPNVRSCHEPSSRATASLIPPLPVHRNQRFEHIESLDSVPPDLPTPESRHLSPSGSAASADRPSASAHQRRPGPDVALPAHRPSSAPAGSTP